jgi:hypothetical protein
MVRSHYTSIQSSLGFWFQLTVEHIYEPALVRYSPFLSKYFTLSKKLSVSLGASQ